jgi:hypothetical protein
LNEEDGKWITQTAEAMVREILKQMANVQVRLLSASQKQAGVTMDDVYDHIYGDRQMEVQLRAEPELFYRMAKNIGGTDPQDEDEIADYATEIFNVLCGRFISEICNRDHISMRFNPPQYRKSSYVSRTEGNETLHTLSFRTEKEELLEFAWGEQPQPLTARE